ncbi:chaperonin 10-like protein [Gigaspora rosea]|uniref:Chaperonin 10-like protein n=1 Tax=Gigaspora rosea TaxID=44941 RepID=A0A397URR9_9GLOM|nr:chaperonin 10-like protein [Gigaspora rosea]
MQAITFQQPYKVLVKTVPIPKILQDTDVIVKVCVSGLCGSDLHVYRGDEVGIDKDTIMGHEFMGIVNEIGSNVKDLKVGDRVLSPFSNCCGECFYCCRGITSRCEKGQLFGCLKNGYGIHGGQAEYVRVPLASSTLVKIPEGISDNTALLLCDVLCTGYFCAENGLNELAPQISYLKQYKLEYQKKDEYDDIVVVVVGCGPVGLMSIASAIYLGVKTIYSIDSIQERLEIAKEFGATPIHLIDENPIEKIKEITNGRGADIVLEAVGNLSSLDLSFKLLRPAGVLSSIGLNHSNTFPFNPNDGYHKNLKYISGRCPVRQILTKTIPFVLSKKFNFEKIITHEMKLSDGEKAYEIFEKKLDKCVKVVFKK